MGKLTTHVLDTAAGTPGEGIRVELYRQAGNEWKLIKTTHTNADGRCDAPLIEGDSFSKGEFELHFHAGDYFDRQDIALPEPKFLNEVVLRFGIADTEAHYHVPLLISPYGYSTYRGS
ncbi:hydroxyisourate hydrolase [Sneathiella sp. HT1-7]|jgi:5-hydroxyisourate hydrolase|uniref:hydroxyisourate hydrolase n=1 Tax=Sneathiella sp. HT1-7 TaxID=2887192 RepID=UPI001D14EBB6|nr:hydroxyisourate hydrolase [Sneathiella sp. HT1-7]MCC3304467.1 hydroxyisourate hydrolase [Sneathiella sp. HT1-7]